MKVKSKKRYDLLDITFEQLEVIGIGLDQIDDSVGRDGITRETANIAEDITAMIDEEMRNE